MWRTDAAEPTRTACDEYSPCTRRRTSQRRQTQREPTRTLTPTGSATSRYPRATSTCRMNARMAIEPKTRKLAETTLTYSRLPTPTTRAPRASVSDRHHIHAITRMDENAQYGMPLNGVSARLTTELSS